MVDIWGAIKDTADSVKDAAVAPAGAVLDIANMAFDEKDDSFGSYVGAVAKRTGDLLTPVLDPGDIASGVNEGLHAMNWLYDNIINRPLSTLTLAAQSSEYKDQGGFFDRDTWSKAWDMSDDVSAGQAVTGMFSQYGGGPLYGLFGLSMQGGERFDPLAYDNGFDPVRERFGARADAWAFGGDVALMFGVDPASIGLTAIGAAAKTARFMELGSAERASAMRLFTAGGRSQSRVDKTLDFIGGKNRLQRPLSAREIEVAIPEIGRFSRDPKAISGFLAEANRIDDVAERRNVQRGILALAMGDKSQIARVEAQAKALPSLADAMKNAEKGAVLNLDSLGLIPALRTDPIFTKSLESQLDNLNKDGVVDKFIDSWDQRFTMLLGGPESAGVAGSLKNVPTKHVYGAEAALKRENGTGVLRSIRDAHNAVDARMARWVENGGTNSGVFQWSKYHVPLLVTKPLSAYVGMFTKAPTAITDSLRMQHLGGFVDLDDWGRAADQINVMMRSSDVEHGTRMELLSRLYLARNESEKLKLIEEAEGVSLRGIAAKYNARYGERTGLKIDEDFLRTVLAEGAAKRGKSVSAVQGRAYAAAEMDATGATQMASKAKDGVARKFTVDQIMDDSGLPVHLPLLSSQLANRVPLLDTALVDTMMSREFGKLGTISKVWQREVEALRVLGKERQAATLASRQKHLDDLIEFRANAADALVNRGQQLMRAWKFSVLFRLGYPIRVLMDDHARMWAKMGTAAYMDMALTRSFEGGKNLAFNKVGRRFEGRRQYAQYEDELDEITAHLASPEMQAWDDLSAELKSVENSLTQLRRHGKNPDKIAEKEALRDHLIEQMGDTSRQQYEERANALRQLMRQGVKGARPEKRRIGEGTFEIDGKTLNDAFAGTRGPLSRVLTSSGDSFDEMIRGIEDRVSAKAMIGSHRTFVADDPGHLGVWAATVNHQIRNSPEAMFFLKGGTVEDFARWVRQPEQAHLRRRLPHFAHDAEDWGRRIETMLHSYIPSDEMVEAVIKGRVTEKQLAKMFPVQEVRPAVHGREAAETLGISSGQHLIGNSLNRMMRFLSEVPTDRLSRQPFFAAMYRHHATEAYNLRRAQGQVAFTAKDLAKIEDEARKAALKDVKDTLFDISAHSNAAHAMRFVSPFFAAHQESLTRWWRLAGQRPAVVRRVAQVFDVPRHAGLVVDENGEKVEPGSLPSVNHRIMLRVPFVPRGMEDFADWVINESSFNLLMPQGPTNPGLGPVVQVPLDYLAKELSDEPTIRRVASIFNPYPPQSAFDSLVPATYKRLSAYTYAKTGADITFGLGIGAREFSDAWAQELQDKVVEFKEKNDGREPTRAERAELNELARAEATSRMWHRVLWNSLSPAPAQPQSRYAVYQQGWYQIQEQARSEGKDFDWAYDRFKELYGEAYLPIIASSANNPAGIETANAGTVSAIKHYEGILGKVDPALTRAVIGSYVNEVGEDDPTMLEYSPQARIWLREEETQTGSGEKYYSYDAPLKAITEAQARRGWQEFNALTSSLDVMAEQNGLDSYEDDPQLLAIKRAAVEKLKSENDAWASEYGSLDSTKYDRYVADMRQIVADPSLADDPSRTDIATLGRYLEIRDFFTGWLAQRQADGVGGPDAAANAPLRKLFTALVDALARQNTMFQSYMYDTVVSRDPLLLRDE